MRCRKEAPSLEKLYNQFRAKDFILFRINSKENQKNLEGFLKDNPTEVPILLDKDGKVGRLFGVWVHPSTYLVDRRGNVRYRAVGAVDWMGVEALSVVTKLLEEE